MIIIDKKTKKAILEIQTEKNIKIAKNNLNTDKYKLVDTIEYLSNLNKNKSINWTN